MKKARNTIFSLTTASLMIAMTTAFIPTGVQAAAPPSKSDKTTLVYFVRHGEDTEELADLEDPSFSIVYNQCDGNVEDPCCVEALNMLGRTRGALLADWFVQNRIAGTLTHVIASHKIRTRQTVAPIALAAGLGGDLDGDGFLDGTDIDLAPGDGVINVPDVEECEPGYTGAKSVIEPQTAYINGLPLGSKAVVCSHSPALYPIMDALGVDTSDPVKFPRRPNGKVQGYNNLWIVELKPVQVDGTTVYQGCLLVHLLLDFQLSVSAFDLNTPGPPAMGGE